MTSRMGYLLPFSGGVISHVGYFAHGEHHLYGALYLRVFTLAFALLTVLSHAKGANVRVSLCQASELALSYLAGVFFSLVVYRCFLHPLRKVPGPPWARLSGLWLTWAVRRGDASRQVKRLHDQYGPIVRIGPTDLSIAHPSAVEIVHGFGAQCTKGPWYDINKPMVSLQTYRTKPEHDQRRRLWSNAFGDRALRGYEQRLHKYRKQLFDQVMAHQGQPMNVTKWLYAYSFDVMGDIAFGKSFNMLETGREHWAVKMLNEGLRVLGCIFPPWLYLFLFSIPGLTKGWLKLIHFAEENMRELIKTDTPIPGIGSTLAAPLKGPEPQQADIDLLRGDGQLIVSAGSETTAVVLTLVIYELAWHPQHIDKLRQELAPYIADPTEEILNGSIQHLGHLNAVINEVMRLYPPVPTQMQRKTPPQGIEVEGVHIPGNTCLWTPLYAIGRNDIIECSKGEAAYEKPNEFRPERWTIHPEMVRDKSGFAPFSLGARNCIGKPLALLNLRTTIARIVTTFDFAFAPGEEPKLADENMTEGFSTSFGDLMIVFSERQRGLRLG